MKTHIPNESKTINTHKTIIL